jgi:glucuronoarabinoxylan endo-1,4-beta-xylanase
MKKMSTNYLKKNFIFFKVGYIGVLIIITLYSSGANAQSLKIKGTVYASATPVRYASVVFIDNSDTSKKISLLTDTSGNFQFDIVTGVKSDNNNVPANFTLEQNYPNPFSSSTAIPYQLKKESDTQVIIYDILGREVRRFTTNLQTSGSHNIVWNARNNFGVKVATGIYFYRLQAGGESKVKKMVFNAGSGNGVVSLQSASFSEIPGDLQVAKINLQGGSYTIQISNTASTSPVIIAKNINNVELQSDTTINLSVDALSIPVSTVYTDSVQQIIRGFGAANIIPWRPDMTTNEVNTAFGMGTGQLGFSILRLRVPYTDNVSEFSANIPSAKLAESLGAIVFATPWTPPPAMKSNNNIVGGTLNDTSYVSYAAHLKSFADYMANNGAPLYAISVQNEPDANVTYESCSWDATQFLNFMKYNASAIGTPVMMPESESFVHTLSDATLNDSAAAANVSMIGGHIYGGGLTTYPLAVSKGKEIWMTEHLVNDTTWSGFMGTAKEINDCMNAGMSAYVWWYIIRFYGPINENGIVTKRGYIMSQYAKFIRPGFYKIYCNANPQRNIYITSYKDSTSKIVTVVLNLSSSPVYQTISVNGGNMSTFTQYTTSATKNCENGSDVPAVNGSFTVKLDASSITTFISNK